MSQFRTSRRSDLAPCSLPTALLTTWLLVIDLLFSCCWLTWFFDSSWSTDHALRALRPYIGHPGTVISPLRTARGSPRIQFGLFVLDPRLPHGVRYLGAILLNLLWHVARRRAVLLLRCGTSFPGPKSTAESKVRCVPLFSFSHRRRIPHSLSLSLTSSSPCRPPCITASTICGEFFNSSQTPRMNCKVAFHGYD